MRETHIALGGVVLAMLGLAYLAKPAPEVKTVEKVVVQREPEIRYIDRPVVVREPEIVYVDRPQVPEKVERPSEKSTTMPDEKGAEKRTKAKMTKTAPQVQKQQRKTENRYNPQWTKSPGCPDRWESYRGHYGQYHPYYRLNIYTKEDIQ